LLLDLPTEFASAASITKCNSSFGSIGSRLCGAFLAFGGAQLREGVETMLAGDVVTGKAILRDYKMRSS
jgi:hypothetical protein